MTGESPTPPRSPRAFEEIAQRIRERIASGELKAGDRLPPEREMAEQFKVGRNAIREAMRTLEMAGVLRLQKGRNGGAYIRAANATRMTLAIQDLLDYGSIELDELTESRIVILEDITQLAAQRGTDEDFDAIEHNIDQTEAATEAGLLDQRAQHAAEFYGLLARATHNRVLVLLVTSLSQILPRLIQKRVTVAGGPIPQLVTARRRFLHYLRARDPARAFAELKAQVLEGHRLVQSVLDKSGAAPGTRPPPVNGAQHPNSTNGAAARPKRASSGTTRKASSASGTTRARS